MKWEQEDIVEYLINNYVLHWKNYKHYQANDDEDDARYESAKLDYIFDLLHTITGGSPTDIADMIDPYLEEGMIEFNPQTSVNTLEVGTKVCVMHDIPYADYDSFCSMFDDDDLDELLNEVIDVGSDMVYIPKGTYMTYKGCNINGWPTFEVHGFEFDFAGDPFKIKIIN